RPEVAILPSVRVRKSVGRFEVARGLPLVAEAPDERGPERRLDRAETLARRGRADGPRRAGERGVLLVAPGRRRGEPQWREERHGGPRRMLVRHGFVEGVPADAQRRVAEGRPVQIEELGREDLVSDGGFDAHFYGGDRPIPDDGGDVLG